MALKPGFSLMEWIRLTKSGRDLAGTGGRFVNVTADELRKHRKRGDAWIALNGKFGSLSSLISVINSDLIRAGDRDGGPVSEKPDIWFLNGQKEGDNWL